MKISGKGVIIILVFLIGIPVLVDMIIAFSLPNKKGDAGYGMTGFLIPRYARALPFYIAYVIIAFAVMYLIKRWRDRHLNNDE